MAYANSIVSYNITEDFIIGNGDIKIEQNCTNHENISYLIWNRYHKTQHKSNQLN